MKRRTRRCTRGVLRQTLQQVEIGAASEVPPELATTLRELDDLAAERQRIYFSAMAEELVCTQLVEVCRKKSR